MPLREIHNEDELLQKVALGDEKAFSDLYTIYCDKVYAIGVKFLQSPSLAQDVTQEVFLKLWLNNTKLSSVSSFKAYLYTNTRNHIYNQLRKQANEELLLSKLVSNTSETPLPADELSVKQLRDRLYHSLSKLPTQQRRVFEMGKLQGLKHEEIARVLFISSETVKKHMMSAVRTIKNFFI